LDTVNVCVSGGAVLNVAVTVVSAVTVTMHDIAAPEHPPPVKPANDEPAAGVAVNITLLPSIKLAEHMSPQSIPAGELLTRIVHEAAAAPMIGAAEPSA